MTTVEPTVEQLRALERAMSHRRGFRQLMDEIADADEDVGEEEEWTPVQRECLTDFARAVLNA